MADRPDLKYLPCCAPSHPMFCPACAALDDGRVHVPMFSAREHIRVSIRHADRVDPKIVNLLRPYVNG